ncbi:MAG: hypothetical protein GXP27_09630 [Planctomycetes bacterium]|nr:hypothetical protein [Planctomycetota bacterium]
MVEPNGVTIRYCRGRPLGLLLATIRREPPLPDASEETMLREIPVGTHATVTAFASGTLYLRVNDFWSELADNSGGLEITIRLAGPQTSRTRSQP